MNKKHPRNICLFCGKTCNRPKSIYCNNLCQHQYQSKLLEQAWLAGQPTTDWTVRKILFNKFCGACSICGWKDKNPITNNVPLEVDHINGDWRDNSPSNVWLLCPNCHSLTPTFRGLNKRPSDREVKGQRKKH